MYAISVFIGIANALMMVNRYFFATHFDYFIGLKPRLYINLHVSVADYTIPQVTAISMQSVLVGAEVGGCAFVCGSLSFLDKMSCGLALYVLQSHQSKFLFGIT